MLVGLFLQVFGIVVFARRLSSQLQLEPALLVQRLGEESSQVHQSLVDKTHSRVQTLDLYISICRTGLLCVFVNIEVNIEH